mgnify:CR=1 FL=1
MKLDFVFKHHFAVEKPKFYITKNAPRKSSFYSLKVLAPGGTTSGKKNLFFFPRPGEKTKLPIELKPKLVFTTHKIVLLKKKP